MPPASSALAGSAEAADPAAAAQPGAPDYDGDARDLVEMLCGGLCMAHPRLDAVYTDPARARIAGALARVMQKYQWDLGMFGPELVLAAVLAPAVVSTAKIMREDWAADKAQIARPAAASPASPASPAAAPGSDNLTSIVAPAAPAQPAVPVNAEAIKKAQADSGANLFKKA